MTDLLLMLTCSSPWLYSISLIILSGIFWALLIGLCRANSDGMDRVDRHVRETDKLDEYEEKMK